MNVKLFCNGYKNNLAYSVRFLFDFNNMLILSIAFVTEINVLVCVSCLRASGKGGGGEGRGGEGEITWPYRVDLSI